MLSLSISRNVKINILFGCLLLKIPLHSLPRALKEFRKAEFDYQILHILKGISWRNNLDFFSVCTDTL